MSKEKEMLEEWEWDKHRCVSVLVVLVIIFTSGWLFIDLILTGTSTTDSMKYTTSFSLDADRYDTLYYVFFGFDPAYDDIVLYTISMDTSKVYSANKVAIAISWELPFHMNAIIIAEMGDETNILHQKRNILDTQTSYSILLTGKVVDMIMYLFCDNCTGGSLDFSCRVYRVNS